MAEGTPSSGRPSRGVTVTVLSANPPAAPLSKVSNYQYRVKIINPTSKKDSIIRDLRQFSGKFKSLTDVKVRLMEEFGEQLPTSTSFSIGYFAGRKTERYWIYTEQDLRAMYTNCSTSDIIMWCEGRKDEGPNSKRRKTGDGFLTSRREDKEQQVEELAAELKVKNDEKLGYNDSQYRMWARMNVTGLHSSKETPPQVPMVTGVTPKRKQSIKESIVTSVVKAVSSSTVQSPIIQQTVQESPNGTQVGVSPGKVTDIRGKSFGQLSMLKQLYDDNIITQDEFDEQKGVLRNYNDNMTI